MEPPLQLNFQRHGEGFPLLILHGLFGSLDNWQTVSRKLGETHQVFSIDLRNHGRSPHSDIFNYPAMADDLRDFMAAHQLPRAHVLGHSLGGKTAMHFALRFPDLVEKLIIVDMAPRAYAPSHGPLFDAMLSLDLASFRERSEIAAALEPSIPDLATRQFLLKNIARDDSGAFRWKLNLPVLQKNYNQLNAAIAPGPTFPGPVLFIKGERSDYLNEFDVPLIHQLFPCSTVKTVPAAGHWVHADAPDQLINFALKFLR
jgi:pimeloyl-ACP methyl ester carboxylesterase